MIGLRAALAGAAMLAVTGCTAGRVEPVGAPADAFPVRFQGAGTEPFWSLAIDGARVRFATPEDQQGSAGSGVRRTVGGDRLILTGRLGSEDFRAELSRASCSDGMSDKAWPYRLILTVGSRHLSGCAEPQG